jgi:TP901 family phage tail tape measure protein
MLQLQFASAVVTLSMDMGQFNRDFATLQAKLTRLPRSIDVAVKIDTSAMTAGLTAISQQIAALRQSAQQPIRMNIVGGGGMGGTRGGGTGGGGFAAAAGGGGGGGGGGFAAATAGLQAMQANQAAAAAAVAQQQATAVQAGRQFRQQLAAHHAQVQAQTARHNQQVQSIEDRAFMQEYQARGRRYAQIQSIEDRYLMSEYRGRVAHQARLKALAEKMAAEDAALQQRKQAQFGIGLGMGAGMPFAMTPQMAAGQAVGMALRETAGQMKESIDVAMDLETRFATLARVSGKTADEIAVLKRGLIDLSTQKGIAVPLGELVEFATQISKAGVSAIPEIMQLTGVLAKLKVMLPEMGAEQMAIAMTRVLTNFKLGSEHAEGFASALIAVDNETKATAQQIFNIANRLSGIAGSAGASATAVLSISGGLAGMGNNAESAATSMGQMFTQMATKVEKFAKVSGVSTEEFARAYREDPVKALQIFLHAFNKLEDTIEKAQFMEELGIKGQRSKQTMMTFAGIIDETVARVPRLNEEMQTGAALMASTGHEAAKTAGSFTRLSNAVTAMRDSFAGPFLAPLAAAVEALGQLTAAFERTGIAAATSTALIRATGIGMFIDIAGAGGTAGAPGAAGAGKKLPALPEKKIFHPPGEGLPEMPNVEAAFGIKEKKGEHGHPAVPGVPMRFQFEQAIFDTEEELQKRNEAAQAAQEEKRRTAGAARFIQARVAEQEASGIFDPESFRPLHARTAELEGKAAEAARVSAEANEALIAARDQLAKLKELQLRQKGKEDLQDIGQELRAGVGNLIGRRMQALGGLMKFGANQAGDMADWVKERNKDKPHMTIGRSVMDYAEKVTESVLNQEADKNSKETAAATKKAAGHLENMEKAMLKGGGGLINAGWALLGGGGL